MNRRYTALKKQIFSNGIYSLIPIRNEDRLVIMKWRNEQIYHLRQNKLLSVKEQNKYFSTIVASLFDKQQPDQILFSYLEGDKCIGYGGLVHINWIDRNAEISFVMDTTLEKDFFEFHWTTFLGLIITVAFEEIGLHKIFTYAFNLRPRLYRALEEASFKKEAVLKDHSCFDSKYYDVVIHSKIFDSLLIRDAKPIDLVLTYKWATNPTIRKYAFSNEIIKLDGHKNWFLNKINDNDCEYYILIDKEVCIGSIRFDIGSDNSALISYLIDPSYHNKGYGKIILDKGLETFSKKRSDVKIVYGYVQKDNIASIKIFEKLGFKKISDESSVLRFDKIINK